MFDFGTGILINIYLSFDRSRTNRTLHHFNVVKAPGGPPYPSFSSSLLLQHLPAASCAHVSRHNEKQLVCGVKSRMWPRVLVCAGEMAAALIVWHGAGSASCQKSSSDSPMGMMAHLTNASLTKRASDAGPTFRRGTW